MQWNELVYPAIQDGPVITQAVFNYINSANAFDALTEKAGFIWYIDYDKTLYFMPRNVIIAPWALTRDMAADSNITVSEENNRYRNKQYIKGGKDITDPIPEDKKGDSKTRTWVVSFPIAKEPTITLNSTPSDVGILAVETGKHFYWSKGSNVISQDESQGILTDADDLSITYQGEYDIVAISYNQNEIDDRASIEGSTGVVEDVEDEPETATRDVAFQSANAKLERYGRMGKTIKYRTWHPGLAAGQIQVINLPEHQLINVEALVQSVCITKQGKTFYYNVTAVTGPETSSWTNAFKTIATRGQAFVIRQNISEKQILVTLEQFNKTWEEADSPNIFKEIYAAEDLFPAETLFPMFVANDRVKYIELLDGTDTLILRKYRTKQEGSIISTFYILPFEAIDSIATLKWYGGTYSTLTAGTGVLIDTQAYSKVKIAIESIQIEKTDTINFVPMTGTKALTIAYWQGVDDDVEAYLTHSA